MGLSRAGRGATDSHSAHVWPASAPALGWAIECPCFLCMMCHNVITVITQNILPQQDGDAMERQLRARDVKLVPIGNSQGVRIPKALLQKYGLSNSLVLEETDQGILLRKKREDKLSWEDTFKAMAEEGEDWTDLDATLLDGLEEDDIDS
jgi:antitoxin MazE